MSIRVSEVYHSYQGEGPNTSSPTLFVRFVGCNLKCPGWPCDTQHAIDPKLYRKDMKSFTPEAFADYIEEQWRSYERICFTGGEVTLQPSDELERALVRLKTHTGAQFELFTNGTLPWSRTLRELMNTIIMDWKLPGSGEIAPPRVQDIMHANLDMLGPNDAVKFTIKDYMDCRAALSIWKSTRMHTPDRPQVYCGPVWGSVTAEEVADWMMQAQLPWNLNVQTHKFVWDPDKRGV